MASSSSSSSSPSSSPGPPSDIEAPRPPNIEQAQPSVDGVEEPPADPPQDTLRTTLDRLIDGFKEHRDSRKVGAFGAAGKPPLRRGLETIQLQFIAFGGAIGMALPPSVRTL
jgi:hypothetical protein